MLPILLFGFVAVQGWSAQTQDEEKGVVKFQERSGELQGTISLFEPDTGLLIVERNSITLQLRRYTGDEDCGCEPKRKNRRACRFERETGHREISGGAEGQQGERDPRAVILFQGMTTAIFFRSRSII